MFKIYTQKESKKKPVSNVLFKQCNNHECINYKVDIF